MTVFINEDFPVPKLPSSNMFFGSLRAFTVFFKVSQTSDFILSLRVISSLQTEMSRKYQFYILLSFIYNRLNVCGFLMSGLFTICFFCFVGCFFVSIFWGFFLFLFILLLLFWSGCFVFKGGGVSDFKQKCIVCFKISPERFYVPL